jgi:hypothetical protein
MNIKNQSNVYASWALAIFFLGVTALMGYTTWHAVFNATHDPIMSWLSLFVFDAGAFAGYQMVVGNAKGAEQRASAQAILWIDFALAAAMVGGALDKLPTGTIGYVVWVSVAFNALALYYYKTHSLEVMKKMQDQDEEDSKEAFIRLQRKTLFEEASKQAKANLRREARELGALWAFRTQIDFKLGLDMPLNEDERKVFDNDVIDAKALPVPADMPIEQPLGFLELLKGLFTRGLHTPSQSMPLQQVNPSPLEQPKQEENTPSQ